MSNKLKDKALRLLARREHSRFELQTKLSPFTDNPAELANLLDELEQKDFLSDERFVASYIRMRILAGRGSNAIAAELVQRGISSSIANNAVKECEIDWSQHLADVWQRKFGKSPQDQKEYARQVRFLVSRGFAYDAIIKLLSAGKNE